jgi:hypothetical protein
VRTRHPSKPALTASRSGSSDHLPAALPARTLPVAAAVSVALVITGLVVPWTLSGRTDDESERLSAVTGFETSHGMAVWWSSVLFLLAAQLAYTQSRPMNGAAGHALSRRWKLLAGLFVWTSFDHATHAHVEVARQAAAHLHLPGAIEPLTCLLLVSAAFVGLPLFRAASPGARRRLAASAVVIVGGAWGVDVVLQLSHVDPGLASRALESGLEWAGLVMLIRVLIDPTSWPLPRSSSGGS